jgi:hypothetical protein
MDGGVAGLIYQFGGFGDPNGTILGGDTLQIGSSFKVFNTPTKAVDGTDVPLEIAVQIKVE